MIERNYLGIEVCKSEDEFKKPGIILEDEWDSFGEFTSVGEEWRSDKNNRTLED